MRARRRLALLASVGPIIHSPLDYEATLERIARLAIPELADWCLVGIVKEDGSVSQLAAAHVDPAKESLLRELIAYRRYGEEAPGIVGRVLRTGRPMLIAEFSESSLVEMVTGEEHLRLLRDLEICSLMSLPLLARGRTLGAMTLVSSSPKKRYDEDDLSLAQNLSYRCALAVDNARLYRDRSFIARTLQRSLLPELPEIPGVEIGVEYLPVGEENEVGGDFYDLIEADDCWIAVIGDIAGKGAAAAAVTALARYTIRAVAMREDEPSAILSGLNEAMIRQRAGDEFCTVACARLKLAGGRGLELTVARGGHPAPLVLRTDGSVEAIGPPGKALGIFPDPELEDRCVRLEAGDAAVFYTDGVVEARGPDGSFFGERRLLDLLRACTGLEAPAIAEKLRDVVVEYGEGHARDDLAVLVVRVPK